MRNNFSKIALAAGFGFAITFTFSCSGVGGTDPNGGGKGNDIANYRTVDIGGKKWMAENLDYAVDGSVCYDNDPANCTIYGRLYNWSTAMGLPGICPSGWHIPSDADWDALVAAVGGEAIAGTELKANSSLWSTNTGTDNYDFAALPGGFGNVDGSFSSVGNGGNWWSATEGYASIAYSRLMYHSYTDVYRDSYDKAYLLSVRCVSDANTMRNPIL